jgi:hypothetical protein
MRLPSPQAFALSVGDIYRLVASILGIKFLAALNYSAIAAYDSVMMRNHEFSRQRISGCRLADPCTTPLLYMRFLKQHRLTFPLSEYFAGQCVTFCSRILY